METNNIILVIIILVLFLFYCKKNIKRKKRITQKYGLTKIKNKDNVIEYYTNLPGENCNQITDEFVNQMIEKQEMIRFTQEQIKKLKSENKDSDVEKRISNVNNLNKEIKKLHQDMKNECSAQSRCRVKFYGPDDQKTINDTICKPGNPENINDCRPATSNNNDISTRGDGSTVSDWDSTLRKNGSRFIKFNKVITDSWENILISNMYMANNDVIGPDDFEYQLNKAMSYVIKYDKDNFSKLFKNPVSKYHHNLFKNNPSYKIISPFVNNNNRNKFENGTLINSTDINRCKDILKILFMKEELGEIYTPEEINTINDNYREEQEDDTIPAYLKKKYDEIITRVDGLNEEDTLFILKNKPANILVESYKNIFDYCDFVKPKELPDNPTSSYEVQKLINSKTSKRYYSGRFNINNARNDCENNGGEFIDLYNNEDDLSKKNYYCISREPFKNPKNTYYYSYYDKTNENKLINGSDFEDFNVFKDKIKQSNIDSKKVERRKTGIKSGNRIFSLSFDDLCKKCDKKFNGHGVLGSIFDQKTQDYKVTSCVNSEDTTDKNNNLINPLKATENFFNIDNNENFIEFTKVELEIEDQEDMLSKDDYYSNLKFRS